MTADGMHYMVEPSTLNPTSCQLSRELEDSMREAYVAVEVVTCKAYLCLGGFILAGRRAEMPLVTIIVIVSPAEPEFLPRIFASIPAEVIVARSAGREPASVAAKDVLPTVILADCAAPRVLSSLVLIVEVVMITVNLQPLLKLC